MNLVARIVVAAFPLVSLAGGCSSQHEGQRCDLPEDCEIGLACDKEKGGVCCPPSGKSTVPACNSGITPTPDAGSKADASADQGAPTEAASETSDETDPEASAAETSADGTTPEAQAAAPDAPTE